MISSYSEFQPLREVVVGRGYSPDYFDHIADSQVRDMLQKIFNEIEEDFIDLIKILVEFGVRVTRPDLVARTQFEASISRAAIVPPITPRDRQTVFGRQLVQVSSYTNTPSVISYYQNQFPDSVTVPKGSDQIIMQDANASCVYRMGRDIWFDESDWLRPEQSQWLIDHVLTDPAYRFHRMRTFGHSDCVFAVLKPGVILTSFHDAGVAYAEDFPGWHLFRVEKPSILSYTEFINRLHPGHRWWVPGVENLDKFRQYVDQYLNEWVGQVHESVFDVNCLSIDTEHVIFACYNQDVFRYCETHGIKPILCELRHRFFFDGGVHCCTLDIEREGGMEDYFG